MKHLWRLTSVIDCGTMNWEKRVLLWFQLSEYDVEPQDTTLPIYKQFAKTPYGWLIVLDEDNNLDNYIAMAWKMFDIEIEIWEYQWKPIYNVVSFDKSSEADTFEWWVDVKTFKFTDETTLNDIKELWFDNKHVKNSDEYNILKQKTLEDENLPF